MVRLRDCATVRCVSALREQVEGHPAVMASEVAESEAQEQGAREAGRRDNALSDTCWRASELANAAGHLLCNAPTPESPLHARVRALCFTLQRMLEDAYERAGELESAQPASPGTMRSERRDAMDAVKAELALRTTAFLERLAVRLRVPHESRNPDRMGDDTRGGNGSPERPQPEEKPDGPAGQAEHASSETEGDAHDPMVGLDWSTGDLQAAKHAINSAVDRIRAGLTLLGPIDSDSDTLPGGDCFALETILYGGKKT